MNIKQIKALAKVLKEQELTVIEFSEGDTRIRLEKTIAPSTPPAVALPLVARQSEQVSEDKMPIMNGSVDFNEISEVKSPMVGVFYEAPSPDSEPFVKIGDRIKKGDVLCIIEAMKVMNEITAEIDGEIVDICAKNGQVVEFGQTLFKVY